MAEPRQRAVFLEREGYRRRRLIDTARLVPFVGLFLFGLPVLWAPPGAQGRDMATTGIYLFLVWFGLIAATALLARILGDGRGGGAGRDGD